MNCPVCGQASPGEVCGCHSEPPPTALLRRENEGAPSPQAIAGLGLGVWQDMPPQDNAVARDRGPLGAAEAESVAWRDELSVRLSRYRARRKIRPPRYPSLRLPFEAVAPSSSAQNGNESVQLETFDPVSDQALALSELRPETAAEPASNQPVTTPVASTGAKIIEFPRSAWAPPPPLPEELAEPVGDLPRILDVPETAPPAPALGGITIEPAEKKESNRRPGVDLPLQSAPLARRLIASALDGLIVSLAAALFGAIFWKVTAFRPPLIQLAGLGIGVPALLWAGYQYLLIVYAARTPGLRLAGLELARFNGTAPSRSQRRWRVLASYLSAASLGMGYAWVFLDEDLLCWHDRTTRTYLAPSPKTAHEEMKHPHQQ